MLTTPASGHARIRQQPWRQQLPVFQLLPSRPAMIPLLRQLYACHFWWHIRMHIAFVIYLIRALASRTYDIERYAWVLLPYFPLHLPLSL